jgi:hypothetical protein
VSALRKTDQCLYHALFWVSSVTTKYCISFTAGHCAVPPPPLPEKVRACDVQNLIHSMKLRKACRIDGIPNECLRHFLRRSLVLTHLFNYCCDSSVGIALGHGLDDRDYRVRLPAGAGNFSLHHCVQNGSGAHPASYTMGTRGSFPGGKVAGVWSWPLTSI